MSEERKLQGDSPDSPPTPERRPPSPFLFSLILIGMGLWFAYDGFLNAEFIQKHAGDGILKFNQWGAAALIGWGALDFYRMRQLQKRRALERSDPPPAP